MRRANPSIVARQKRFARLRSFRVLGILFVLSIWAVLGLLVKPVLFPGSGGEDEYVSDRQMIQKAVDWFSSGYHPNKASVPSLRDDSLLDRYPTFARLNAGTSRAFKEKDAGSTEITTLGAHESNPVGDARKQGGTPFWEDVDGDGVRVPESDSLFHYSASPEPAVDHWNTTRVNDGTADYVVDSRDWFVDFTVLVEKEFLKEVPASASLDNYPGATGSYSWYVDGTGRVHSLLYSGPVGASKGYRDVYP